MRLRCVGREPQLAAVAADPVPQSQASARRGWAGLLARGTRLCRRHHPPLACLFAWLCSQCSSGLDHKTLKQEEIFPSAPRFWCFRYFSLVPNYNKRSTQTTPDLKSMRKLVCTFSQSDLPFRLLCFHPANDFSHRSCSQQHRAPPCTLPTAARPPLTTRLPPPARQAQRIPAASSTAPGGTRPGSGCAGTLPGHGVPRHRAVPGVWLGAGCIPPTGRSPRSPQALHVRARLSDTDHRVPSSRDVSWTWRDGEGAVALGCHGALLCTQCCSLAMSSGASVQIHTFF